MSRSEHARPDDVDGWRKNAEKMGDRYQKVKDVVRAARQEDSHDPGSRPER